MSQNDEESRPCMHCNKMFPISDLRWVNRFGYPFKKVCGTCADELDEESEKMEFSELDAGERLDDDY